MANRLLSQAVNEVKQRQNRMPVNHAGTGIPHHGPDLLPHSGLVAMHRTLGARRFALLERTLVEALPGITQKLSALEAKLFSGSMLAMTIDVDHTLNSLVFPCYSWIVVRHDECLLQILFARPPPNGSETTRPLTPLHHPGQPVRLPSWWDRSHNLQSRVFCYLSANSPTVSSCTRTQKV